MGVPTPGNMYILNRDTVLHFSLIIIINCIFIVSIHTLLKAWIHCRLFGLVLLKLFWDICIIQACFRISVLSRHVSGYMYYPGMFQDIYYPGMFWDIRPSFNGLWVQIHNVHWMLWSVKMWCHNGRPSNVTAQCHSPHHEICLLHTSLLCYSLCSM